MKSYHKDEEIFKVNRAVAIVAVVEVKLIENCDIVDARYKWSGFIKSSERRATIADEERR